ncbi:hypothetical protein QE399_003847 [Paracidovorax wautersii]|uniref:Antirepressor protein ant N-terminal domain-containing protein n=2 Tax=Paracidovorax wautersii TaxID=1177982 RepID=A0ABU1IHT9_9BURK|nr:hypothetical protein [Paracidovorax wautersii]
MKPIITGMGLTWHGQHAKIKANSRRWGVLELRIPSPGGLQDMLCMPLRKLPGWLSGIEAGKVKSEEARVKVREYQDECDDVLWQYWNDGIAVNPRATYSVAPNQTISAEQAETLRLMLTSSVERLPKSRQALAMRQGWSKLKAHFRVGYRQIPDHEFSEAVSILARHAAEWEVVEEDERANTINEQVARWVKQIDSPNGVPAVLFAPLVAAVNRRGGGYRFPLSAAEPHDRIKPFPHSSLSAKRLLDPKNRALEMELVEALSKDGHDVEGVRVRLLAMRDALGELMEVRQVLEDFRRMFRRMDGTAEAWADQSRGLSIMFRKKLDPNDRYDRIGYPEQLGLPRPSGIQYLGAAR